MLYIDILGFQPLTMKAAFRNLPIWKEDWRWLGMMAEHPKTNRKFYFIDKTVPFGASVSCCHFQRFSDAVEWIYYYRTRSRANNYLDDFLMAALFQGLCNERIKIFLEICYQINFPVSLEKTCWASQIIVFLGMPLSTTQDYFHSTRQKRKDLETP